MPIHDVMPLIGLIGFFAVLFTLILLYDAFDARRHRGN